MQDRVLGIDVAVRCPETIISFCAYHSSPTNRSGMLGLNALTVHRLLKDVVKYASREQHALKYSSI